MAKVKGLFVFLSVGALLLQVSGCGLFVGGAAAGAAAGGISSLRESRQREYSPIIYAGTVIANMAYFPAKVLFAAGGAVTSGVFYLVSLGDPSPSDRIWEASVEGDYVMTPEMLAGERPVRFVGPDRSELAFSERADDGSRAGDERGLGGWFRAPEMQFCATVSRGVQFHHPIGT